MKNSRRILSAFLVLLMLLSCFSAGIVFAEEAATAETATTGTVQTSNTGAFSDVSDSDKFAQAVKVLNKLAIINGYPDGTFGPNKNVTRAEFTAMLLRMLNMEQTAAPLNKPFTDVETTHWAAGTIGIAKSINIVTGYDNGSFGPDNNVSYEEALTMIIRSIGYENYGEPGAVWYSRYVNAATRLKINDGAVGAVGTPATRACIAQFIYNTLEVNSRENNEIRETTIMEDYLGLIKENGVITSNGITSLTSPDIKVYEGEITIRNNKTNEEETFTVSDIAEYADMLGAKGTYYYRENISTGEKELVLFTATDAQKTEIINASLLKTDDCDDLTIAYYKTESQSAVAEFSLADDNIVIYNDKLYVKDGKAGRFSEDLLPTLGRVKLLNTDSDKDFEIIFIDSYEVFVVSTVTASNYKISDKITGAGDIVLDDGAKNQDVVFVNKNGEKRSFSDIKKNSTLCIKQSHKDSGRKLITVVIVDDTIKGEVQNVSLGENQIKVGGTYYDFSLAAPWVKGDATAPEEEKTYTFFLDLNGDIVALTEGAAATDSSTYGFIIGYGRRRGTGLDDSTVYLNILTSSGNEIYPLYKSTKINGSNIKSDYDGAVETLERLAKLQGLGLDDETREEMGARQVIKFTTKTVEDTVVIDEIRTVTDKTDNDTKGGDKKADELRMYSGFNGSDEAKYASSALSVDDNKVYIGSAVIFIVPDDVTDVDSYKKGSSSNFKSTGNYVEIFDMSSSKSARVIVLYGGNKAAEVKVTPTTALVRIEESFEATNNGDTMLRVTGYEDGASGTPKEYWVSPSSEKLVKGLLEGDIVRFGKDSDGYVTLEADNIFYRTYGGSEPDYKAEDASYKPVNSDSAKTKADSDMKFMLGSIYSVEDGVVIIAPEFLEAGEEYDIDVTSTTEVLRLATSKFTSSVKYYEYDMTGSNIKITELTDYGIDAFNTYIEDVDATKVLIHIKDGNVKSVTIIEE